MTAQLISIVPDTRVCNLCKEIKPLTSFSRDKTGTHGRTSFCKPCRNVKSRESYKTNPAVRRSGIKNRPDKLKRLYGVTYEQIVRVLDEQHGMCANRACGKKLNLEVKGTRKDRAVIDHNHKTGKFRALLCIPCNSLLGSLETKENILLGLMEYRTKHENME